MESSVKSKIGKIDQFLSSDAKLLKISEVLVLLKEEKLKKKKILKKQLNQAKGITIPVKRKNMKLPKRKKSTAKSKS